jgi:hypothetical protein
MFSLVAAAAAVVAAVVHLAAAAHAADEPRPHTLWVHSGSRISAFAQDGNLVAWFETRRAGCNRVHILSVANGIHVTLPRQGSARNVTCSWPVGSTPVGLALAAGTGNVVWTLREQSPIPFDYLLGAGVGPKERAERRYQEMAHTARGSGLWLSGISGDRATLVYGATSVDYVDEAGCLAGTAACRLKVVGGGVYRMAGGGRTLVPGTERGAVAVAASGTAVAYVPTAAVGKNGRPVAGGDLPIEIVDVRTGASIARVVPQGTPLAIALTPHLLATLERTPLGLRVAWYDRATGSPSGGGSVPVSRRAASTLAASDTAIVYRVGRAIRAVATATHAGRAVARAASTPIGLSREGRRLAWAENLGGSARIRTLELRP